jgi:hypothetical protein
MAETTAAPVVIKDSGMRAAVTIYGRRIGFGTSRNEEDPVKWAEIEIYACEDGTFTVHRAGYSNVYHTADTRCLTREGRQRGRPARLDDLPDDAVPCTVCAPPYPDELGDDDEIRYEVPRHTFAQCENQVNCLDKLTVIRHRDGSRTVQVSRPVRDALREAAQHDPGFRRIWEELDEPAPQAFGRAAAG